MNPKNVPALNLPANDQPPSYAPPSYDAATSRDSDEKAQDAISINSATSQAPGFNPSIHLVIETAGFNINSLSNRNWYGDQAIPVFRLNPGQTEMLERQNNPDYLSIRPKKGSNSCALIRGDDQSQQPIISTVYRWGPGRDPIIRMYGPNECVSIEHAVDKANSINSEFEVNTHWVTTRSVDMATPYGKFEWRYAKRSERKDIQADSLIVCDRLDSPHAVAASSSSKKAARVRIAHFIRNSEYRTQGTSRWHGGNGGRLMIDLGDWSVQEKSSVAEEVESLILASCLLMLKRETDAQKNNQMAVLT